MVKDLLLYVDDAKDLLLWMTKYLVKRLSKASVESSRKAMMIKYD